MAALVTSSRPAPDETSESHSAQLRPDIIARSDSLHRQSTLLPATEPGTSSVPIRSHDRAPDSSQAFAIYTPLDEAQSEIRIATLYADDDEYAPIRCALKVMPLESAGDFIALSYCWGTRGKSVPISVDGEQVAVQMNLWRFLQRLRYLRGTSRIWVDYLCIDQQNYREKGPQVKLMTDVFQAATAVYAWLGEATKEINEALSALDTLQVEQSRTFSLNWRRRHRKLANAKKTILRALAPCAYWTRIWIVQEVLLARTLRLVVGRNLIEWPLLQDVGELTEWLSFGERVVNEAYWRLWLNYSQRSPGEPLLISLGELILVFSKAECHEPRDRIYGMLGLLASSDRCSANVNYTVSLLQAIVDNIALLRPDNGADIQAEYFYTIMRIVSHSTLPAEVTYRGKALCLHVPILSKALFFQGEMRRCLRHTVAALPSDGDKLVTFTTNDITRPCDVYVTLLRQRQRHGCVSSIIDGIMYSRLIPQGEDLVLAFGAMYLIVRQRGRDFEVIDCAVDAVKLEDEPYHWIDPRQWLKTINPEAEFTISQSRVPRPRWKGCEWKVKLNGAALGQMAIVPHLTANSRWTVEDCCSTPIQSVLEDALIRATDLITCHSPEILPSSTTPPPSNMMPIYFQQPMLLPSLRDR